ncbi:LOW QUALITY PROTEIN: hypothetical protein OSB04_016451 [Centaurea solstitialis]|uniref:Integrase catalytic domain-containing protein n=1 Tax=Centaurea solstitialis TaxID=347529 RepID=A0AA38TE75_9ASTR|nr:LOW QUALITY PROTEIN: hypothetical protein OSB04_016451 [Centaurea solstitialis]
MEMEMEDFVGMETQQLSFSAGTEKLNTCQHPVSIHIIKIGTTSAGDSSSSDSLPLSTMIHMLTIKLSSSNYLLWMNQVTSVLSCQDLLGYVDGTSVAPTPTITTNGTSAPNPAYTEWCKQDQRLQSLILSSLTEEAMAETIGCKTARMVRKSLEAAFCPKSTGHAMNVKEELRSLQRGSSSVAEYGRRFKALSDQLSILDQSVDEVEKSHWFLRGLGPEFTAFSAAQMTLDPLPSYRILLPRVVNFQQFETSMSASSAPPVAFTAHKLHPQRGRGHNHGGSNRRSHSSLGRGRGKSHRSQPCQICGALGHLANQCYDRYNRPPSANLAEAFNATCTINDPRKSDWYLDTGASAHMTPNANLDATSPYSGAEQVTIGNGTALNISHVGHCSISPSIKLLNVLVVPELTKNLLSISQLTSDLPVDITFSDHFFVIQKWDTKEILAKGRCNQGLYVLERSQPEFIYALYSRKLKGSFTLWHSRLGHVSFDTIKLLNNLGHLSVTSLLPTPGFCSSCQLAKSKRLSFDNNDKRAPHVLDLVHCDLWGPAPTQSMGYNYYAVFVDDYSRFTWMFPLRAKSEFFNVFLQFQTFVENQFTCKIKVFQSDDGGEFTNARLQQHFQKCGIHHAMSCPYTPAQNGRAERKHRHITETGLAMLFHANAPSAFWLDAFSTAVYTINRLPTRILDGKSSCYLVAFQTMLISILLDVNRLPTRILDGKSPYEMLFGRVPNYANFHPFGCQVFPYLRDYAKNKLAPRSISCIFLGYSTHHKGFRCLEPKSGKVYITRHAQFNELEFPFSSQITSSSQVALDFLAYLDDVRIMCETVTGLPCPML